MAVAESPADSSDPNAESSSAGRGADPALAARPVTSGDRAVLRALTALLGSDPRLQFIPHTSLGRQAFTDIHTKQTESSLRHLRSRYFHDVPLVATEFSNATIRAAQWADSLSRIPTGGRPGPVDRYAYAALVAALARRLIIDGPDVAAQSVRYCQRLITDSTTPASARNGDTGAGCAAGPAAGSGAGSGAVVTRPRLPNTAAWRSELGRRVRDIWVAWAREQPHPKPSWLQPWDDLDDSQREVDERIGLGVADYVLTRLAELDEAA